MPVMDPKDQTFMTIHNLAPDANILFASDSIYDILGYQPYEVQGQSCFAYFHPEEVPFARSIHSRGILLDKAAVLHYARILSKDGRWVSCECCFTIVHDVLVACTSIYLRGEKSKRRALEAPHIRRIFSCSPRDPRYHMLEHLSPKFKMPPMEREPRAALILNRFTRNLSIMFATNAVSTILGLRPDEIKDKSFYECIQENCLQDAIQCLESAKANESIAYLRFWLRDPRTGDGDVGDTDEEEVEDDNDIDTQDEDQDEADRMGTDSDATSDCRCGSSVGAPDEMDLDDDNLQATTNYAPDRGVRVKPISPSTISSRLSQCKTPASPYRPRARSCRRPSSPPTSPRRSSRSSPGCRRAAEQGVPEAYIELEAVVSCTSDGLVVVLRKSRPLVPPPHPPLLPAFNFENGLFAAPWGQQPIRPSVPPNLLYTFRPPLLPQHMPLRENVKAAGGPPLDQLMRSIRDVAVFAWPVVGINGNMAAYGRGLPSGQAQPVGELPPWDPPTTGASTTYSGRQDGRSGQSGQSGQSCGRWPAWNEISEATCLSSQCQPDDAITYLSPEAAAQQVYGRPPPAPEACAGASSHSAWRRSSLPPFGEGYEPACHRGHHQYHQQHQSQQRPTPHDPFSQTPTWGQDGRHQHHHHTEYQQNQQQPAACLDLPREPWAEASSSRTYNTRDWPIPTTQTRDRNDLDPGVRYMWQ